MLTLRVIHILAGVLWVGGAIMLTMYLLPTAGATQEAGPKFMGHLMTKTSLATLMLVAPLANVIAGFWLFGIRSEWFTSAWMMSSVGTGYTIGAVSALIGLHFGFQIRKNNMKLMQFGGQIQGAPTPEQATQLQALRKKLANVGMLNGIFVVLATVLMSVARYLV